VKRLLRRRFLALLIVLLLLIAVYPLLQSVYAERLLLDALLTAVFVTALFAVFTKPALRVAALLLGIPALLGVWTRYVLPGAALPSAAAGLHMLAAAFLGFCVATILRTAYDEATVSADSVYGALCSYLLIGLAFGHVYCVLELLAPGSFLGNEAFKTQVQSEEWRRFQLTYFSFMTLTTVGYGDITPASDAAKGLAMVEAVAGQFYIAVLVAELIGKRVSQVISGRPPGPTG
jgi:voltage-gated potassium channel